MSKAPKTTTNKGREFLPDIFSDAEVQALIAKCNRRYPTGLRNRALIGTLYRSGIRISEAIGLLPKDLVDDAGMVRVHFGKGKKSRVVGMDAGAFALVREWMRYREEKLGIGKQAPVFCTLAGRPIKTAYVRALLPRLAKKAGIQKRVHAHGFRHTHAAQLLEEGTNVGIISQQLGHESVATTAKYLDHIAPKRVVEAVASRQWTAE